MRKRKAGALSSAAELLPRQVMNAVYCRVACETRDNRAIGMIGSDMQKENI